MNLWELPTSVTANGHEYPIRTDYRAVLDVLTALSDKDMTGDTPAETNYIQSEIIRQIMFEDPDSIPWKMHSKVLQNLLTWVSKRRTNQVRG